jgi:hypothetical protein
VGSAWGKSGVGVVSAEFGFGEGIVTEIGARVGVGPPLGACTAPPTETNADSVPPPPTGAKGSYVGYVSAELVVLQEIRRVTNKKQIVNRYARANIRKILPKGSNKQGMGYDFVISFARSLAKRPFRTAFARLIITGGRLR